MHSRRGGGGEWDSVVGVAMSGMLAHVGTGSLVLSLRNTAAVQTPLWQTAHQGHAPQGHAQPLSAHQCAFCALRLLFSCRPANKTQLHLLDRQRSFTFQRFMSLEVTW